MFRPPLPLLALGFCLAFISCSPAPRQDPPASGKGGEPGLELKNLMTAHLEGVSGTAVIVSHVTIPPNTSLPKHWHPGEEFAYVLEGSATLWQKGKRNLVGKKGEVLKVPLKQIHTATTGPEGVTLLVFRVHEIGQPERIKAD